MLIIKRTSSDIDYIHNRLLTSTYQFRINVRKLSSDNEDLAGAVSGLFRLQNMYKLKTSDIINGIIAGQMTNAKLSNRDIFAIVKTATENGRRDFMVGEYLSELQRRIAKNEDNDFETVTERDLEGIYTKSSESFNKKEPDTFTKNGKFSIEKESIIYSQMCRMEISKSPEELKSLKCRYVFNSPYSMIGPFKVEEADLSTNLVLFHDVVYDSEIEVLKNMSKSRFKRGLIYGAKSSLEKTDKRVAKIAWLHEHEHEVIRRISKRIEVNVPY